MISIHCKVSTFQIASPQTKSVHICKHFLLRNIVIQLCRIQLTVWTYGHFASRIPVLYVFCRLLKNTSKIRPFFKFEGRGSVFCPKAAKSSNLKTYYGAHLCEDLIDLSGTQILVLVVSNQAFPKFKAQILSALKKSWRTFAVFPFSLSKILKNTWFLTPLKHTRIPYVQTMIQLPGLKSHRMTFLQ
jgi:hypothetical protein